MWTLNLWKFPHAAKFQHHEIPYKKELSIMFDGRVATGKHAYIPSSSHPPLVDVDDDFHNVFDNLEGVQSDGSRPSVGASHSVEVDSVESAYTSPMPQPHRKRQRCLLLLQKVTPDVANLSKQ